MCLTSIPCKGGNVKDDSGTLQQPKESGWQEDPALIIALVIALLLCLGPHVSRCLAGEAVGYRTPEHLRHYIELYHIINAIKRQLYQLNSTQLLSFRPSVNCKGLIGPIISSL